MEEVIVNISKLNRSRFLQLVWRERVNSKVIVRRQSTRTTDRVKAEIMRREKQEQLRQRHRDPFELHAETPLLKHLDDFIETMRADGAGSKQIHLVQQRIRRVLGATRMKLIRDLSPSIVKRAVAAFHRLIANCKRPVSEQPLLSAQSRNYYLKATKQFARWLMVDGRMPGNPLFGLKGWNVQTDRRHDRDRLLPAQFAKLVSAAVKSSATTEGYDGRKRALLYQLAYATGLRRSELASLTPISFKLLRRKSTVTVRAACAKNRQQATIRLHDDLVEPIRAWLEEHPLFADEPLFPYLAGKKTGKMMQRDLKSAGIPYQTDEGLYRDFHALRHSFISNVWDAGATPPVAQRLARHSDIRLTMRYSHTDSEAEDAVIKRMPGLPKPNGDDDS